jgi:enoyl-CoA hydratase/carnithine racemase
MAAISVAIRPDGVAVLTFDQPGSKANVLTGELWTEFSAALAALDSRIDLKGLVLASAKPGIFIAGADLKLLGSVSGPNDPLVRAFMEQGLRVLEQLEALPFPTCAAIDGAALGGGLEVALACDFRFAGSDPKFRVGAPEVKLGLIPGWGGTQRLPRIVAVPPAARFLASGESTDRDTSPPGLIDQRSESSELIDAAARYLLGAPREPAVREAKRVAVPNWPAPGDASVWPAPGDSVSVREVKRVTHEGTQLPFADAITLETEAFMRLAGSDESKRLISEFFASRKR